MYHMCECARAIHAQDCDAATQHCAYTETSELVRLELLGRDIDLLERPS